MLAAITVIAFASCQKTEVIELCGSEKTVVGDELEINSQMFDNPCLHLQEAKMQGDTLLAEFGWSAAYGGHVHLIAEDPQGSTHIKVKAVFEEYPPYCVNSNIIIDGSWNMSAIKDMVIGNEAFIDIESGTGIVYTLHCAWK